jgi:G3E family GTPase
LSPIPVVVLSTVDEVLRDTAVFSVAAGPERIAVLRLDLDVDRGLLHRVVSDRHGIHDDVWEPLEHACLGCALREVAVPTLAGMVSSARWDRIVLALPVGGATAAVASALAHPGTAGRSGFVLAAVATVVDLDAVRTTLFGDVPLRSLGPTVSELDSRTCGEALVEQLRHADLVLVDGADPVGGEFVDHLRGRGSQRAPLLEIASDDLFFPRHFAAEAAARLDPLQVQPGAIGPRGEVWTLDLLSPRPLHPTRFLDSIGAFGRPDLVSRGRFQLLSRPATVGEWDAVGRHISIGNAGRWPGRARSTRLVFTGLTDTRDELLQTFTECLASEADLQDTDLRTAGDGFDAWLGWPHAA